MPSLIDPSVMIPLSELMQQAASIRTNLRFLGSQATARIRNIERPIHHQVLAWAEDLAWWTRQAIEAKAIECAPNQPEWFSRTTSDVGVRRRYRNVDPARASEQLDEAVMYLVSCVSCGYNPRINWHMTFRGSSGGVHKWLGFLVEFGDGPARRVSIAKQMQEAGTRLIT